MALQEVALEFRRPACARDADSRKGGHDNSNRPVAVRRARQTVMKAPPHHFGALVEVPRVAAVEHPQKFHGLKVDRGRRVTEQRHGDSRNAIRFEQRIEASSAGA